MTEYDYSPEAFERQLATQARISKWANSVSQSTLAQAQAQSPSQFSSHPPSDYLSRSRPTYPHRYSSSQSQSRSNSVSRSHSRDQPYLQREPSRQRSHSYSNSRPQASRVYSFTQPLHSRTYSYAMNHIPPPAPIPVPQPPPYSLLAPRRSRTLPTQAPNVVYHTYNAPHGHSYVVIPSGGVPQQMRMQSAVTPTKRAQPLLKRLFTSFGPWGSSSSGPSPSKSKHPHQSLRRHRRRSF
ncbi:hypothetical protein BC827DRAFT_1210826 [Russula dissimulans]|nr:hypothetical protein BC827DRAFT_1210826 [Russula dissimulans]